MLARRVFRSCVARGVRASSTGQKSRLADVASRVPAVLQSVVGGTPLPSASGRTVTAPNAATGGDLCVQEVAGAAEVDAAVDAAVVGQAVWAATPGAERARVLRRAADLLRARNDELAEIEALDTGRPIAETRYVDIVSAYECLEFMASLAATTASMGQHIQLAGGDPSSSFAYTRREPLGVCAGIGAWNYPIQGAAWKAAPALACGNALIFKPSENTPLTALAFADVLREAGVPDGCFSVLLGDGSTGALLAEHPRIAKVSFTGSVPTGKAVYRACADTMKKVTLELGGKSPLVIMDDADLDNAVSAAMVANWYSCGEVCSNGTRVFVQHGIMDAFVERLVARTRKLRVGNPLDDDTDVGALVSPAHMERVANYVAQAHVEGAELVLGGDRVTVPGECALGSFMNPTIFAGCTDDMTIVQEEIFGPVMSVLGFDTEEEALARANATPFGLSAGVFTKDLRRAHRMVAGLQAGTTWVNNYNLAPVETPWRGFKQSGVGQENGTGAIEHWSQEKSVYIEMGDVDCPYE